VGGYIVRARRPDAWDAIVALLIALDARHGSYFHTVMRECRRLSNSRPEVDGLDNLLPIPEQHLHNVTVDRERRRAAEGYATPADARAFLQMARQDPSAHRETVAASPYHVNPLVAAYFRAVEEDSCSATTADTGKMHDSPTGSTGPTEAVFQLLAEAGMMPDRPRALLEAGVAGEGPAAVTRLRQLMEHVRDADESAYFARTRELAFLGNALLAGCSIQSRPFTASEAADAAASVCNLGLELWNSPQQDNHLVDHDLVAAFEVGWSALHRDVSMFVVRQLVATLDGLRGIDLDTRRDTAAFRVALVKHRDAGTPWLARNAANALAPLDMTAWISVVGLLDECPILPATLTAILERRTAPVSPHAFDFISTPAQIGDIRVFMGMLPHLLSR
jgi:hypothetical protein